MVVSQTNPGRFVEVNGTNYLYFGGTSYLGLATHTDFQDMVAKNIRRWGTAWGSSRMANVQLEAYAAAEQYLQKITGAQAALTISSGMLAGKLVTETLARSGVSFFHFPGHHPAIYAPGQQPFYIDGAINPLLQNDIPQAVAILTDAVPPQQVYPVGFHDILKISPAKKVTLVIDESHTLGIVGKEGGGLIADVNLPGVERKIMVASLGKALGVTGGVIGADISFIKEVQQNPFFTGGAGMNPAFAQTLADAAPIINLQRKMLRQNLQHLDNLLGQTDKLLHQPDYPVLYPMHESLFEWLLSKRILITHFQYPTSVNGLSRIIVSAHHTTSDLAHLADSVHALTV